MKELKKVVEKVLSENLYARNEDHILIFKVYEELGFDCAVSDFSIKFRMGFLCVESLKNLPSCESITRLRRQIQNVEKKFLPTDLDVLLRRRFTDEDVKLFFGEQSSLYDDFRFVFTRGERIK